MVGIVLNFKNFPRDRLVSVCRSSSKADIYERFVKEMRDPINADALVARLESTGIEDAQRIVDEIDVQCKEHLQALEKWVSNISEGVA